MENQISDTVIHLPLYRNIVTKQDKSKLFFSWIYGLFGLLLLVYLVLNDKSMFELQILLFILCTSIVLALVMYRLYMASKQTVYAPANVVVREVVTYYNLKNIETLKEGLRNMDFLTLQNVEAETNGNIRLDIFISIDKRFVAAQLFQFIPYRYRAITPIYHYHDEIALLFLECIDIDLCKITLYRHEQNESY